MNPEAIELNEIIKRHPAVYGLLSERGKAIFFPKRGILSQSADAKGKKIAILKITPINFSIKQNEEKEAIMLSWKKPL